eukprot:253001-Rhodomonas_salina.2
MESDPTKWLSIDEADFQFNHGFVRRLDELDDMVLPLEMDVEMLMARSVRFSAATTSSGSCTTFSCSAAFAFPTALIIFSRDSWLIPWLATSSMSTPPTNISSSLTTQYDSSLDPARVKSSASSPPTIIQHSNSRMLPAIPIAHFCHF